MFLSEQCAVSKVILTFEVQQSFSINMSSPQSFCYLFIALSITRCSKSAQKFAVRVFQVSTVVMATTQLVLSQLKTWIEWGLCLPKIISKRWELVKWCDINRSGPVFFETQCIVLGLFCFYRAALTRDIDYSKYVCTSVLDVPGFDKNVLTYCHRFFHRTAAQSF